MEEGGDVYGQPTASAARPDVRAITSRHKGDQVPGTRREDQGKRERGRLGVMRARSDQSPVAARQ